MLVMAVTVALSSTLRSKSVSEYESSRSKYFSSVCPSISSGVKVAVMYFFVSNFGFPPVVSPSMTRTASFDSMLKLLFVLRSSAQTYPGSSSMGILTV